MFVLGSIACLTGAAALSYLKNKDDRELNKIKAKWNNLMDGSVMKTQNKFDDRYELLDIFIKHYGFDAIVSLPVGLGYLKIRELLPLIESAFGSDVIVELTPVKTTAYMRVHYINNTISDKDNIRFNWYKLFNKGEGIRNSFGETYTITNIEDILNPNNNNIVGYKLYISVPTELSYEKFISKSDALISLFGKCYTKWNEKRSCIECQIIIESIDDNEKFKPIRVKPYELYVGMTHAFKPVLLNYKNNPNTIVGGKNNTGKTVCLTMGITNLCYFYDENDVQIMCISIADKTDLRVFKDVKNCIYYADNLNKSLRAFQYIIKEAKMRNKLFESDKKNFIVNIHQWNKKHPDKKLPFLYVLLDEVTCYMLENTETKAEEEQKKRSMGFVWKIARECRSAGIWITFGIQRGDINSIPSPVKAQMGNKICFYQPSLTSAQTVFGDNSDILHKIIRLPKQREAFCDYDDGIELMKTLYFTPDMARKLLKNKIDPNHKCLDINAIGEVNKEITEDVDVNKDIKKEDNKNKELSEHQEKQNKRHDNYKKYIGFK